VYRLFLICSAPRQFVHAIFSLTMEALSLSTSYDGMIHTNEIGRSMVQTVNRGLLPRSSGINLRQDHVGSLVGKVPRQVFLSVRQFFPVSINAPELHTHSCIYHIRHLMLEIDSVVK
jgi:hypothetical protein